MKKLAAVVLSAMMLVLFTGCDMFPVPSDPYGKPTATVVPTTEPAASSEISATTAPTIAPVTVATTAPTEEQTQTDSPNSSPTTSSTPAPTPTPDPTEGMIFPDSDDRLLMWDELISLSAEKLDLARNEIFARAGYSFTKDYYQEYYEKLAWYDKDPGFSESKFTDIQHANITLLRAAEGAIKGQLIEIKSGTKLDYDQDGNLETLIFSSPDENHMNLKIKDGSSSTAWSIECTEPSKKVYLGDIDMKDGILDLFVDEFGPSDDYLVYVAGIQHKSFLNRETVPGTIKQLKLDKKGSISTSKRMNILMTWFCSVKYKLNQAGKLVFVAQTGYSMGNFKCKTKVALSLKAKAVSSSTIALIVPAGTDVSLVSTDDKHWIKIKTSSGEGWLEMENAFTLMNPNIPGIDAFDGLVLAD